MGRFMDVKGLGPAPIMPIWSWVWKYMLEERPAEEWNDDTFTHSLQFNTRHIRIYTIGKTGLENGTIGQIFPKLNKIKTTRVSKDSL